MRSAFTLVASQRVTIQATLDALAGSPVHIRFETAADLIGSIELSANGWKLAWSIVDYLGGLEKSITSLLEAPVPAAAPHA